MIQVTGVTKSFGTLRAVDNVDLHVNAGEFLSLLGPSGCGKTTLLRLIAGFEQPDSGRIVLGNEDVTRKPPYLRDVTQVFQSYALFPHMSVWRNVAFGLRMRGLLRREINERVAQALAMVSLTGADHKKPRHLSGGMQQRVALARAIVCRPKVLLLDEPLSALDAKLRESMQLELRQLHQQLGMTFLFVTHDQAEALTMSDRVAVMNQGRVEQIGSPSEVYLRPTSTFVANFVGQANLLEAKVLARDADHIVLRLADAFELSVASSRLTPGVQSATLLVRPEKIQVFNHRAFQHDFPVTIRDAIFTGATTRLKLTLANGAELTAVVMPTGPSDTAVKAGRAFARIDPADVHVLEFR